MLRSSCAPTGRFVLLPALVAAFVLALLAGGARSAGGRSGLIAFARADGIYVMRADGSGVRAIRRGGMAEGAAGLAWSPDGRKLAFVTGAHGNVLWVMSADGSDLVRLVLKAGNAMSPTWSPDGRKIAFTAYHHGRDIWVMNADGSSQHRLVPTRIPCVIEVDWNPIGDRIAYSECDGTDVHVMSTNGGNRRNLTPGRFQAVEPDWSPDGRRIAFRRWQGSRWGDEIYVVDPDGRSRVRLTDDRLCDRAPAWSPDGRRIAFIREVPAGGNAFPEIFVMNADGTGLTRLTHNRVAEWSPAWQPVAAS